MSTYPYGTDYACIPDLDGTFSLVTDVETVIFQSVYKKLTTDPGVLDTAKRIYRSQYWDSSTMNLKSYLGVSMTSLEKSNLYTSIMSVFQSELRYSVVIENIEQTMDGIKIYLLISETEDVPEMHIVFSVTSSILSVERVS